MTMQYEQEHINLSGRQAVSTLIFDSNASQQTDIIFNDWNALLEQAQATPGIVDIVIDGANTIPAGTYDMTDIRLIGADAFASAEINDAVFQNLEYIESLTLSVGTSAANTVASFQIGASQNLTMIDTSFVTGPVAVAPVVAVTGGANYSIVARGSGALSVNPGVPVFAVDAVSAAGIAILTGNGGNNWGGGLGSPAFTTVDPGGVFTLNLGTGDVFWAQNQVTGPTTVNYIDDYEAAVVGDWSGSEPLNVKNALDRIAAAVGPIP